MIIISYLKIQDRVKAGFSELQRKLKFIKKQRRLFKENFKQKISLLILNLYIL